MTTVIDYQYSVPSAYAFPARYPHHHLPHHHSSAGMAKQYPQHLSYNNAVPRGLPTTSYLTPSASPSMQPSRPPGSPQFLPTTRRTNSTSSSAGLSSHSLHRSTSNGSSGSSNAYVTTLRKQKATVWCDRAQREDSRFLAAQKAAKARAAEEVARAASQQAHHRSSESGSSVHRGKISHHGRGGRKSSSVDHEFSTNRSLVAGVPARLDIDDDTSDEDQPGSGSGSAYGGITRRTNSGRSSINSAGNRRFTTTTTSSSGGSGNSGNCTPQLQIRIQDLQNYSGYNATNTSSPSTYSRSSSLMETAVPEVPEAVDTPGTIIADPRNAGLHQDYFPVNRKSSSSNRPVIQPDVGMMPLPMHSDGVSGGEHHSRPNSLMRAISSRAPADLRRKGSIDDSRTMTMGRVRLFVANPDQ
ncbi:hypothetical protein Dda_4234 [Drechslerella dactyloides]|uniref:Uncharacterized protein n=1 Tax=Drechslerella dactyloides TaxID=74499 RepID=A0AAD6NK98_DREDA|nr:hypothetical protein Dda_4234 [Drechslerella dactyloides]